MEEFSEFSSEIVEFQSTWKAEKSKTLTNKSTGTDPIPEVKCIAVQTNKNKSIKIQTHSTSTDFIQVNEKKLANWLKKIYPLLEFELLQGITPLYDTSYLNTADENIQILPYQKILLESIGGTLLSANLHGVATWLSIKTNNAPILVVTTLPVHNDWCNHINPTIKLFTPKRIQTQDYIAFSELTTIVVKACIKSLCTNPFNKDIFVGGTVSGDLYIWKYSTDNNSGEINELFCETIEYGCIIAIDWLSEYNFLTCHENGIVLLWKIGKELLKDKEFKIFGNEHESTFRLTTILTLSTTNFLLGTAEGNVFYCSNSNTNRKIENYYNPVVMELEEHKFSIISLNKTILSGSEIIVSCDLSGEIYFYDITNSDDGPNLIVKMPLPFKNSIAFSKSGNFIMCPGIDGSLEVLRTNNGNSFSVPGYENGKGSFIKISDNGVLLFPPVNNYRRFLIHRTCEDIGLEHDLITFSIGFGCNRRTVICYKNQLIVPQNSTLSLDNKTQEEKLKNWRTGNNKLDKTKDIHKMGVEKNIESFNKNNKNNTIEKYRPPALRKTAELTDFQHTNNLPNKISISDSFENTNETIKSTTSTSIRTARRERRPDRAVYIPRARRSEINNPQTITISLPSSSSLSAPINNKSNDDKIYNQKRTTLKDNNLPSPHIKNISENDKNILTNILSTTTLSNSVITNKNCDKKKIIKEYKNQFEQIDDKQIEERKTILTNSINLDENCDSFEKNNQNFVNRISTNLNTSNKIMNLNNKTNNLTDHNTDNNNSAMRIEGRSSRILKKDQEIDELQRASKEINRSNRRIIKQSFNSDVLEIPEKININKIKSDDNCLKKIDPDNDDWDTIYDDNGECFDPKIIAELTASVGKVKIETPKADYSAYLLKQAILSEEEFPHVLEISNFPVEFKTQDLFMIFSVYKESGFDIKWVDDTHALAVFSSSRIAAEVLAMGHPFVKLKPLAEATLESRTKAKKCSSSLQPYRPRPETCAALARRLVTGALGVRLKTAAEERENEKRVLKEAKERKLLAAKQRDEVWES